MDKFDVLSNEMREENKADEVFLDDRISPQSLRNAYETKRAVITEQGGRIIAIGVLWDTDDKDWLELGSLWVAPDSRGEKLASGIYERRIAMAPEGKRCFVVSHNPIVASLALKYGFKEATREDWLFLAPFEVTCGPCDRKVADKATCPHRAIHNECRLFVR